MMDSKLQTKLKKYYREIRKEIPNSYPGKKDILNSIRQSVENFLEEQPDPSFDDILEHFGNTTEIVSSFIEDLSAQEIAALLKKDRRKRYTTRAICVFAILIVSGLCYYIYLLIVSTPVEITETTIIYPETEYIGTETEYITETEH